MGIVNCKETNTIEKPREGSGSMDVLKILDEANVTELSMLALITLKYDSRIGFHKHYGEGEFYYVVTGQGVFEDDEGSYRVSDGDFCYISPDCGHGLANTGERDMTIIAGVYKDIAL